MDHYRIALANVRYPTNLDDSVEIARAAIAGAAARQARLICFPECFVPGYRRPGKAAAPPDAALLERAWRSIAAAAAQAQIAVVLGTERYLETGLALTALVINADGTYAGFQDKVQLDPSEEYLYVAGCGRRVFQHAGLTFGVSICHEGFRYPETVRFAARQGAQLVLHPHFHEAEPGSYRPSYFGDPANSFHEKAALCRAAENTIFYATVNCASQGSGTTSAVVSPDGSLLCYQPYGQEGLLVADLNLSLATRLLAMRCRVA